MAPVCLRDLTAAEHAAAAKLARSHTAPAQMVQRAQIIWRASRGETASAIAARLGLELAQCGSRQALLKLCPGRRQFPDELGELGFELRARHAESAQHGEHDENPRQQQGPALAEPQAAVQGVGECSQQHGHEDRREGEEQDGAELPEQESKGEEVTLSTVRTQF